MRHLRRHLTAACLLTAVLAHAQGAAPSNTIRIWGDTYMASLVQAWEQRFAATHPGVRFENRLMGTDTAMPGLYNGLADIALFGRQSNQTENDGFLHTLQYRPLQLRLTMGSLNEPHKSYAPVFFVAKENPLSRLTMAQADALLGWGQPKPVSTWGDLGLDGAWKDKPVHAYTFDLETGTGLFLLDRLQGPGKKMNWKIVQEYRDIERPDGSIYEAGQQTMDALRHDPFGIAVSGLRYAEDDVRAVALAGPGGGAAVLPTAKTVTEASYPLARTTYAFINQAPGQALAPILRDFLRFLYSEEGQGLIAAQGFLPLSREDDAAQAKLLP